MMTKAEKYEIEVDGTPDNLPVIQHFIETTLRRMNIDDLPAYDIQLAVDEITTNIVKHAYKERTGHIWVACYCLGSEFHIVVKDEGQPFDPSTMPPPDLTSELEKRNVGGLGIYFVRRVMTRMSHEYRDSMNIVTMVKNLGDR
jgi:Anti-sigma regulatory factor (Ser/Thr protein kinase)